EATYVGHFEWHIQRTFARPTDAQFAIPGVLFLQAALYLYFVLLAREANPTIGQYFLGLRVEPMPGERPNYWSHFGVKIIELCTWPISLWSALSAGPKPVLQNPGSHVRLIRVRIPPR